MLLKRRAEREVADRQLAELTWQADVPVWLARKADYDGGYTIEVRGDRASFRAVGF